MENRYRTGTEILQKELRSVTITKKYLTFDSRLLFNIQ